MKNLFPGPQQDSQGDFWDEGVLVVSGREKGGKN